MSPVSHDFRKLFSSPPAGISDHMQHFEKDISCESDFFLLARADQSGTGTSVWHSASKPLLLLQGFVYSIWKRCTEISRS